MKRIFLLPLLMLMLYPAFSQVFTNKPVGKKGAATVDSIKKTEYPYSLPIMGAKAAKAGYEMPYSAGLSVQYLWQKQNLVIEDLNVGFNNGPMLNLDEVIRFNNSTSEAQGINFRPDIWILPFLNVYGIFAKSSPTTTVNYGIWVPDSTDTWKEVFSTTSKASFNAFSVGFGVTPTIGVGGGFLALDMNFTWTDIDALDKPAFSYIFDPRFGKNFKFKKKDRNVALWVGGFRWSINTGTNGSLPLADFIKTEDWGTRIDQGLAKVDNAKQQVDTWWNDLSEREQGKPSNIAKYETANRAIQAAGNFLNAANGAVDNAANTVENGSVQYSLNKRPELKWNFMVGGQFQYNKSWMVRGEYGFLGTRNHFIFGLQYRFGL